LADERVDWDNLSHGPTYEEPKEEHKEQTSRQKEAEEHVRIEEAKAEAKAKEDNTKSNDEVKKEEITEDGKVEGPARKEKSKEESQNEKQSSMEKVEEEKVEADAKARAEKVLKDDAKTTEKKLVKRLDEKDDESSPPTDAEKVAWKSFENCGKVCKEREDCFQYVFYGKMCKLGLSFRLGKHVSPSLDRKLVYKSGWMVDRIRKWTEANACKGPEWPDIR
jgi:hypothetical protein